MGARCTAAHDHATLRPSAATRTPLKNTRNSLPPVALQPAPPRLQRTEFDEATSIEASQAIAEIAAEHDEIVYTVVSYTSIAFSCICLAVEPWAILRGARARSAIIR